MALQKSCIALGEVFTKNADIYNFQKLMFGPRSPSTITRSNEDLPIVMVERITTVIQFPYTCLLLFSWRSDERCVLDPYSTRAEIYGDV
ncbi:jg4933 [Pararge aegeria aegeria]|uniref:Jg4933 protein n=1 Tax=Pararge aegeria aegeria TaxID=348720 RepID=A0A8S4SEG4_9NEOP|nr:jg4933 [Pararge aegeria aegeria]